jgi:hypothetical protein
MAKTQLENPGRSPAAQLVGVQFPAWRDALVQSAEDNDGTPEVINLFKSLPRDRYETREEVLRDFAEAARVGWPWVGCPTTTGWTGIDATSVEMPWRARRFPG